MMFSSVNVNIQINIYGAGGISYNELSVCRSSWFSKAAWTVACAKMSCEKWCTIANRVSSSPSENISTAFSLPPQLMLNHSITLQNPRYTTSHLDKRILYWKSFISIIPMSGRQVSRWV